MRRRRCDKEKQSARPEAKVRVSKEGRSGEDARAVGRGAAGRGLWGGGGGGGSAEM